MVRGKKWLFWVFAKSLLLVPIEIRAQNCQPSKKFDLKTEVDFTVKLPIS